MIDFLADSNVIFLLMTFGLYGLIYEVASPGAMLPGITGAICLLLWMFAMRDVPVSYPALFLMVVGIGGLTAEGFFKAYGLLGLAGALAFAWGSHTFIMPGGTYTPVSLPLIAAVTLVSIGILSVGLKFLLRTRKRRISTGAEALRHSIGDVVAWSGSTGEVRAAGSVWKARSKEALPLKAGDRVKVSDIDGLCLIIESAT